MIYTITTAENKKAPAQKRKDQIDFLLQLNPPGLKAMELTESDPIIGNAQTTQTLKV